MDKEQQWTQQAAVQMAQKVNQWIDGYKQQTSTGTTWLRAEEDQSTVVRNLYAGTAGILIFKLELYRSTGSQEALDDAIGCGRDLVGYLADKDFLPCAMFSGWGGYAFALIELFDVCQQQIFAAAAVRCLEKLTAQSSVIGSGRGWIEPMPFSDITGFTGDREIYDASVGAAGAGLVYLYALEHGHYPDALEIATAVGDRLIEVGEPMEVGTQWCLMNDMPFPFTAPNFAHGGAGVAYFLARLYQHTKKQAHLDAAISGARHLVDIAFSSGAGKLICHQKEGKQPNEHFYLGQCHGPAGTARLFFLLGQLTGDQVWFDFADELFAGLLSTGAPHERSFGLWNNVSQCCCDAGIGDYGLFLYGATGKAAYLDLAMATADELVHRATADDTGMRWSQAEHRARPEFIETQTGYMQGAAGVGSFFIHLACALGGGEGKIVFADCPFDAAGSRSV